jgi:hypothetical protein
MGTRSAIGIKHGDVVKAVYCHYDGYLEYMGRVLTMYYQDSIKVNKLISMGDMSGIGAAIGNKHAFNERSNYLDNGIAEQCTFYARDRGEENVEFRTFQRSKSLWTSLRQVKNSITCSKTIVGTIQWVMQFEELTPDLIVSLLKQPA